MRTSTITKIINRFTEQAEIPLALWLLAGLLLSSPLHATIYTVNSIFDTPDTAPGDNVCEATSGGTQCTLRAAIEEANAHSGSDTIRFSLGLITINITNGNAPLPTITDNIIIDGTTAPSYNNAASNIGDAPPSVYIDGDGLTGTTADGFRVLGTIVARIEAIGITGFPDNGIELVNAETTRLDRNWIGIQRTGGTKGNGDSGIYLSNCTRCVVGQTINPSTSEISGLGNAISNNGDDGVSVLTGSLNEIHGNRIGTNPSGGTGNGNGRHGIFLQGANNRIGKFINGVSTPNLIAHNTNDGIRSQLGNQFIYTNEIHSNGDDGVVLHGSGNKLGSTPEQGNRIYGNGGNGVTIGPDFSSSGNEVRNNRISENTGRGLYLVNGNGNTISSNTLFSNTNDAIRINGNDNGLFNNFIGIFQSLAPGNGANGILLAGNDNVIQTNTIAKASDDGVDIVSGSGNLVNNNKIGTATGGADLGNGLMGVRVRSGASATIISANVIGFNADGIWLEGNGTNVCSNNIGLGPGDEPAGNDSEGIRVLGNNNRIGNQVAGCGGNTIGLNFSDGIQVEGQNNVIRNNVIGGLDGTNFGNGNGGILLTTGAVNNAIQDNSLWYNGNDGIRVGPNAGTNNRIEFNSMGRNGDIGIDLLDNGVTANDPADPDTGPNQLQNTPVITQMSGTGNTLTVTYRVDSSTANASYPLAVDFYLSYLNSPQGERWLQRDTYDVTPNTAKVAVINLPVPRNGNLLLATVVDSAGNSSEYSVPMAFTITPQPEIIFKDGFED